MQKRRVKLEPELEAEVCLFTPAERIALARKMRRWARQLEVSAFILIRDAAPRRAAKLKFVSPVKAALN